MLMRSNCKKDSQAKVEREHKNASRVEEIQSVLDESLESLSFIHILLLLLPLK